MTANTTKNTTLLSTDKITTTLVVGFFGTLNYWVEVSYLDKSMNGIKTITGGVAIIQNGDATFNTINVYTITSSNLTDCNLVNCTANDPQNSQDAVNKNYVDSNFVDKISTQSINGIKLFSVFPQTTATIPTLANELIRKDYVDLNFVDKSTSQIISGYEFYK